MIRPTALGWKALAFFAALWAAFFAAPYQNLFFLLLSFVSALAVLNAAWTMRNVAGVEAEIASIGAFPAGATGAVAVVVSAGSRRRFALDVTLDLGPRGLQRTRCDVADGVTPIAGEISPQPRGIHEVRGAWIESTYPLGVLRARREVKGPREIVVHPAPLSIPHAPGGGAAGMAAAIGAAPGADQPSGLRDFRAGDELRSVHPRASARRGKPVVREWDAGVGEGLEIVLDRRADPLGFEHALGLLAALALAARDTKERLTLHTQGMSKTFGAGDATTEELLRFLAGAERLPEDGPPPPPAATTVLRLPLRRQVTG